MGQPYKELRQEMSPEAKKQAEELAKCDISALNITDCGGCSSCEMSKKDILISHRELQCNLSALLYLLVEQQAVISELLSIFVNEGVLTDSGLIQITGAKSNSKLTKPIYDDLYKKFVDYFLRTKWALMSKEEQDQFITSFSPGDSFANTEESLEEKDVR